MKQWRREAFERNLEASKEAGKRVRHQGRSHKNTNEWAKSAIYPLLERLFESVGLIDKKRPRV